MNWVLVAVGIIGALILIGSLAGSSSSSTSTQPERELHDCDGTVDWDEILGYRFCK